MNFQFNIKDTQEPLPLSKSKYRELDSKFLKDKASNLSYNKSAGEAVLKHKLHEIAMRIETGFYEQI